MSRIALANCHEFPLPEIDEPLRNALIRRGHQIISIPWNGPQEAFYDADIVLLRACWDYCKTPDEFTQWINDLEAAGVNLHNPSQIVLWNMNKRYLLELQSMGTPMPGTLILDSVSNDDVLTQIQSQGWQEAVVKPLVGQGGGGVLRLDPENFNHWPDLSKTFTPLVLQEFQSSIGNLGETILIFFEGVFSHAVLRIVAPGEWRSNFRFGARRVKCEVSPRIIEQAQEVLSVLKETPLYARVDGLVNGDIFTLMELELVEPDLGFVQAPDAAEIFVQHIEDRIQ